MQQAQFKAEFERRLQRVEKSWAEAKTGPDGALAEIDNLRQCVRERLDALTAHDVEKYEKELQRVREAVWAQQRPGRFKFKSSRFQPKRNSESTRPLSPAVATTAAPKRSVSLLLHEEEASLNLDELERSVVVARRVQGAAYINNVERSRIYVNCQQCRLHNCHSVEIYLESCQQPVIEESDNITFMVAGLDEVTVHDFSHMDPSAVQKNYKVQSVRASEWRELSSFSQAEVEELRTDLLSSTTSGGHDVELAQINK